MQLTALDWFIVLALTTLSFVPALVLARRAGSSTAEFFTSGRSAPWWLVGVSMVATTFSTDTPNLVTNLVREHGVANNWAWWAFLLTGMMTVFFYARLWRRSGVLTDLEFYEIRYSGKAASLVRGFRAVYLGLVFNCFIMATVNLAAVKIANVVLGWPMGQTLAICAVLNIAFAATSGLWGVLVTDFIQFGIAMSGAFAAAYFALQQPQVGGLANLIAHTNPATLALLPDFGDWSLTLTVLIIPLTIQWWSVWYPRRGARRRQLHRAAHAGGAHRKRRPQGNVVLQLRALRAASVAVDHRGAGVDDRLPAVVRHPDGVSEHGPDAARS
jgi:Na+/proline symporter